MSRIFDAVHKAERDRQGERAEATGQEAQNWRETASAAQLAVDDLSQVPVLRCEPGEGFCPAATWQGPGQETFRVLHHRLELIRRQRTLKKLLITSSIPKEGKTTVAINLAIALARSSSRVLLIDADLRHPGVHRSLGLPAQSGLGDWLEHRADMNGVLHRLDPYGFFHLSSGRTNVNPGEVLRQPQMREFLARTEAAFDWVVIDSPPVVPFVDSHHLATLVDGVLLVLRVGTTPKPALQQTLVSLGSAFVVGAVLNGSQDRNRPYYNYYEAKDTRRVRTNRVAGMTANPAGGREEAHG